MKRIIKNNPTQGNSNISISYLEYKEALGVVNEYKKNLKNHYDVITSEVEGISKFSHATKETKLREVNLSVRCLNILNANAHRLGIDFIWGMKLEELSKLSMSEFMQCRMAGTKTLQELKELCFYANVKLLP